jgi:hypothetical protein
MQKNTKEKRIGQMQSIKDEISISKLVRKKLFNENN